MNNYDLTGWFPVPIYATILTDFDQHSLINALETPPDSTNNPSYFGDIKNVQQIHNRESFFWLNSAIKQHTKNYLNILGVSDNFNLIVQKSWSVILSKGGHVKLHNHPNSHFSCVFYLKSSSGKIKFYRDYHPLKNLPLEYKESSQFNHEYCTYEPQDGMLIIFPSTVRHEVETYDGEENRYSITYDLILTTDEPRENTLLNPDYWLTL